ncbi:hypothetical protein BS47DRAFT_1339097 [Hydnum rufescens UP504]|uniref:Uncharacterized protein n=1 Tax=Hydnum rufescens UP504 TaxID=1448309 RepID=A0A9P6B527_9AGAM|nr:hypothetical protein BS47DRAFT_1339097 [Hydnum rufescens UP504]
MLPSSHSQGRHVRLFLRLRLWWRLQRTRISPLIFLAAISITSSSPLLTGGTNNESVHSAPHWAIYCSGPTLDLPFTIRADSACEMRVWTPLRHEQCGEIVGSH